jgi:hypothetical protein
MGLKQLKIERDVELHLKIGRIVGQSHIDNPQQRVSGGDPVVHAQRQTGAYQLRISNVIACNGGFLGKGVLE